MRSYQDLTFSTRIQDGSPRDNQRDEKENVWQVGNPQRFFIAYYEVASGPHFFHQDPGWDTKGQPKGQKGKCLAGEKKTYRFFIEFYEVLIGPRFFHKDPVWDRKGQPKGRKLKMSDR